MIKTFKTHTGEIISGEQLNKAIQEVADDMVENAYGIRQEDLYASHISEELKDENLRKDLERAEKVRNGEISHGVWLFQRINTKLTGECIALLP